MGSTLRIARQAAALESLQGSMLDTLMTNIRSIAEEYEGLLGPREPTCRRGAYWSVSQLLCIAKVQICWNGQSHLINSSALGLLPRRWAGTRATHSIRLLAALWRWLGESCVIWLGITRDISMNAVAALIWRQRSNGRTINNALLQAKRACRLAPTKIYTQHAAIHDREQLACAHTCMSRHCISGQDELEERRRPSGALTR